MDAHTSVRPTEYIRQLRLRPSLAHFLACRSFAEFQCRSKTSLAQHSLGRKAVELPSRLETHTHSKHESVKDQGACRRDSSVELRARLCGLSGKLIQPLRDDGKVVAVSKSNRFDVTELKKKPHG